jgi:hypothetical protein
MIRFLTSTCWKNDSNLVGTFIDHELDMQNRLLRQLKFGCILWIGPIAIGIGVDKFHHIFRYGWLLTNVIIIWSHSWIGAIFFWGDQNLITLLDMGDHFLNKGGKIHLHSWIVVIIILTGVDKFSHIHEHGQSFLRLRCSLLRQVWTNSITFLVGVITTSMGVDKFNRSMDKVKYIAVEF